MLIFLEEPQLDYYDPDDPEISDIHALGHVIGLLQTYFTPTVIILGLGTNLVCVVTFLATRLVRHSCSALAGGLAVSDSMFLVALLLSWLRRGGVALYNHEGWCQALTYTSHMASFLSVWYTAALVLERYISQAAPRYRLLLCSPAKARILVICLGVISITVFMNISIMYGVLIMPPGPMCNVLPNFMDSAQILGMLDLVFNFLIPYTIILIGSILTVHRLINNYKLRSLTASEQVQDSPLISSSSTLNNSTPFRSGSTSPDQLQTSQFELTSTRVLLCVAFSFVCWCLPPKLLSFWATVNQYINIAKDGPEGHLFRTRMFLWQQMLMHLMLLRFVQNFFIYLFCYSYFRKAIQLSFADSVVYLRKKLFQGIPRSSGIELERCGAKTENEESADIRL